jgi:threonyl-tRNA synthetase
VEPGGGKPGHRPGPPPWPDQAGVRLQAHRRRQHRGKDPRPPGRKADLAAGILSEDHSGEVKFGVDGRLVDTSYVISSDAQLGIVTDKDPEGLEVIRHSTAHLMAYAVKELFPTAQVTIGPVIENGFYYDFAFERPFTLEDLAAIERRMAELARRDLPVQREVWKRDQAVAFFKSIGEHYKAELIDAIPADQVCLALSRRETSSTSVAARTFPSTGRLKVFKLMKLAGAYWRGDHRNEQLQRIYGTAWIRKEDQDAYLHMLEEAEKRDHRKPRPSTRPIPSSGRSTRHGVLAPQGLGQSGNRLSSTFAAFIRTMAISEVKCAA